MRLVLVTLLMLTMPSFLYAEQEKLSVLLPVAFGEYPSDVHFSVVINVPSSEVLKQGSSGLPSEESEHKSKKLAEIYHQKLLNDFPEQFESEKYQLKTVKVDGGNAFYFVSYKLAYGLFETLVDATSVCENKFKTIKLECVASAVDHELVAGSPVVRWK